MNNTVGLIYAEIEFINGKYIILARRNYIGEGKIKSMRVNMLLDTGSLYMCINERSKSNCGYLPSKSVNRT